MYSKLHSLNRTLRINYFRLVLFIERPYNKWQRDRYFDRLEKKQNAYIKETSRRQLPKALIPFEHTYFSWRYEYEALEDCDRFDFKNINTFWYRLSHYRWFNRNYRWICIFILYTRAPVEFYEILFDWDLLHKHPLPLFRAHGSTFWNRKIRAMYNVPHASDIAVMQEAILYNTPRTERKTFVEKLEIWAKLYCKYKQEYIDKLKKNIKRLFQPIIINKHEIFKKRIKQIVKNPLFLFHNFKWVANSFVKIIYSRKLRTKSSIPSKKKNLKELLTKFIKELWENIQVKKKFTPMARGFFNYAYYSGIKKNSPYFLRTSMKANDFYYVLWPTIELVLASYGAKEPLPHYALIHYFYMYAARALKKNKKGLPFIIFSVFLVKSHAVTLATTLVKDLNFFKNFKPALNLFLFSKKTLLPLFLALLFILFNFIFFKLSFFRVGANWLGVFLFVFWLLSGFNFFTKHARYGKHTTANQRFWKRALMVFWLIEGFLFVIFFYYTLNASGEPLFMFDQVGLFNKQLQDLRAFIFNIFLIILTINLIVYLLITLKYTTFRQQSVVFLLITLILVYILLVESYQFYYLTNYYDDSYWVYSEDEQVWELDYEIPRSRNRSHFMTLLILAKFWHYIFIFGCWVFFVMKALELSRARYAILAMNLQNLLIFYVMAWVCMYAWLKWFTRRFLDQQYYWFFTSFRPTVVNSQVLGLIDFFYSAIPAIFFDFCDLFGLATFLRHPPLNSSFLSAILYSTYEYSGYGSTITGISYNILFY